MIALTFKGGGVRGILEAQLAWHLELELEKGPGLTAISLNQADLFVGTSTGGLVACGLALGLRPELLVGLFERLAPAIFPGTWARMGWRLRSWRRGPSAPRYDPAPLERELRAVFGDQRFGNLGRHVAVPIYDLGRRRPLLLRSWDPDHRGLPIWQVLRATTAAPTYFPSFELEIAGELVEAIDGGVACNEPAAVAIGEALAEGSELADLAVVAFGTGQAEVDEDAGGNGAEWGVLEWAPRLVPVLMDGPADAFLLLAGQLLGDRLAVLDVSLPAGEIRLDDGSERYLASLKRRASSWALDHELELTAAAALVRAG